MILALSENNLLFLKQFRANKILTGNLVSTKQNEQRRQMHLNVIHFQKHMVPTNANLAPDV